MRSHEFAEAVARMAEDLELAKGILTAMVRAKRASTAAPEAWAAAFAAVDRWCLETGDTTRPSSVTCPECSQILPNLTAKPGENEPVRIECGPIHLLHYEDFYAEIGDGSATVHPTERGTSSVVVVDPVLAEDEDEGEKNADVSD